MVGSSAHVGLEPALRHLLAQPQLLLAVPRYPVKEAGVVEGSARRPAYEFPSWVSVADVGRRLGPGRLLIHRAHAVDSFSKLEPT